MVSAANNTGGTRPPVTLPTAQASTPKADRADSIITQAMSGPEPNGTATTQGDSRSALPETVTVKSGDTISQIAARFQLSPDQLKALNPGLFQDGVDPTGKKRGTDGRWIYPGDVIRLRAADASPADPAKTTTVSNKVAQAAKDYLDHAAILPADAAGGKGREVSQKVRDSARTMLGLIPATDPERPQYADQVAKLVADFQAAYPDPALAQKTRFQDASKAFNTASKAYQDASKLVGQLPAADIQAFQLDTAQRALDAYTDASLAMRTMPPGPDQQLSASELEMMQYALGQMGVAAAMIQSAATNHVSMTAPPAADPTLVAAKQSTPTGGSVLGAIPASIQAGGGDASTQQPIGALPGSLPASDPTAPQPSTGANAQVSNASSSPVTSTSTGNASVNPVNSTSQGTTQPTNDGSIPEYHASEIAVYKSTYASANPGSNVSANGTNGNSGASGTGGTNGSTGSSTSNGTNGSAGSNGANNSGGTIAVNPPGVGVNSNPGATQPNPNDPAVKQMDAFLQHASHQDVDNLVANNFNTFYNSTGPQKAKMIQILLEGRTNGTDQSTIAQITDMARQQGQTDTMVAELDRLYGGPSKGINRMFGDLKRGVRDQVVQALFGDPPQGTPFNPNMYAEIIGAMDKKDVEHLAASLGATPGSAWLDRLPVNAKQSLAEKLKSFWPFGGDKGLRAALLSSAAAGPSTAPQGASGPGSAPQAPANAPH